MATVAEINVFIAAATTAIVAGDFATALTQVLAAEIAISGTPDVRHGEEEIRWRSSIEAARRAIEAQRVGGVGLRVKKIEYVRTSA